MGHQLLEPCIRVVQQTAGAVNDFTQIVRWDVGRHTDCDTGGTVDQQVWKTAGQNGRFLQAVIVVGLKTTVSLSMSVSICMEILLIFDSVYR